MQHFVISATSTLSILRLGILLCLFVFNYAIAQSLSNQWNKVLEQQPYDMFDLGDSFALIGVNESGQTVLETYGGDGTLLLTKILPQIESLGASHFDATSGNFYVWGADNNITKLTMARYTPSGALVWKKDFPMGNGFRFPYQIAQLGDQIAFTFAQVSNLGTVTGIGWYLLDPLGNKLYEKVHPLSLGSDFAFPYTSAMGPNGRLIIGLSSVATGKCSLFSFDPLAGVLFWSITFNFPAYHTIETVVVDANSNIYATGDGGHFMKFSQNGDNLFTKTLGYNDISSGHKIIFQNDAASVLGGWRKDLDFDDLSAKMLVGKYDKETGENDWVWIYEHTGIENGPIALNGFFRNDSTLYVHFTRLFESEWIGAFVLSPGLSAPYRPTQSLSIFPSPSADGMVQLRLPTDEQGLLRVFSEDGTLIFEQQHTPAESFNLPRPGRFVVEFSNAKTRAVGIGIRSK